MLYVYVGVWGREMEEGRWRKGDGGKGDGGREMGGGRWGEGDGGGRWGGGEESIYPPSGVVASHKQNNSSTVIPYLEVVQQSSNPHFTNHFLLYQLFRHYFILWMLTM